MILQSTVIEEFVSTRDNILGLLGETDNLVRMELIEANWNHPNKSLMVDLFLVNGEVVHTYCSRNVGIGLRAGEIVIENLPLFPIALVTRKDGGTHYRIEMPTGAVTSRVKSIVMKDLVLKPYVAKKTTVADFEFFS